MSYRIGAYLVDPAAYEIRRADELVPVEPQVFELLIFLIENRQRTVTKDEIIEGVWKGRIVSDTNLSTRIKAARRALGDDGTEQRLIRTVHGRGFRFVGDVVEAAPQARVGTERREAELVARGDGLPPANRPAGGPVGRSLPAILFGSRKWTVAAGVLAILLSASLLVNYLLTHSAGSGAAIKLADPPRSVPAVQKAALTFKHCDVCPEMVELPPGEFMMGAPANERGRSQVEGLPRHVVIAKRFALGKFEVTIEQFEAFVSDTGLAVGNTCRRFDAETLRWGPVDASFRQPGFDVEASHPVVCVSWHEAQAYAAWLGRRTGKPYRLPSESEWEYAARAGTTTSYSFGNDESELCQYARFADLGSRLAWRGGCRSGSAAYGPFPVGKLKPNPWGLFDMHGNAWEWVADCWTANWRETPTDGSVYTRPGGCEVGVIRGGGWPTPYSKLRSGHRDQVVASSHLYHTGFRVALSLGSQ
jgi:formylglycine-generating enzyme required for sulfatase activity